eukprot:5555780-Amphidinium_carterae.1
MQDGTDHVWWRDLRNTGLPTLMFGDSSLGNVQVEAVKVCMSHPMSDIGSSLHHGHVQVFATLPVQADRQQKHRHYVWNTRSVAGRHRLRQGALGKHRSQR